jgi:hypothetical protein
VKHITARLHINPSSTGYAKLLRRYRLAVAVGLTQAADCPSGLVEVNPSDPAVVFRLGLEEGSQLGQAAVSPLGQAAAKH